jgi:TRAP-type C4-dicarboxylate transport system permease small subunit
VHRVPCLGLFGASFVVGRRLNLDVRWVIALIAINLAFTFVIRFSVGRTSVGRGTSRAGTGAVVAAAYAYAPRAQRSLIQISATVAILVLFGSLIWWRTTGLLAQFGIT